MKKLILFISFFLFIEADFVNSVFLPNVKKIKTIYVSYEDAHGNNKREIFKINRLTNDDIIVFSEIEQLKFIKNINLKIPSYIKSLEIEYINTNNKNMSKFVGISLNERAIKQNNLFLYEDKHYNYNFSLTNTKSIKKLIKNTKNIRSKRIQYINVNIPLIKKIEDKGKYVDIAIGNCISRDGLCSDNQIISSPYKLIFRFSFKVKGKQQKRVSKNIKRIQVAYDKDRLYATWLVIEFKKKIKKRENRSKNNNFESNKELKYRIHFE